MTDERTVSVGGVKHEEATSLLGKAGDIQLGEGAVPKFTEVDLYSFRAEWAVIGSDIQIKFFLPKHAKLNTPEASQAWMTYWLHRFTHRLDVLAKGYFKAEYPRLMVKWTEEFQSWWFRAANFDYLLDVGAFLSPFFAQLDESLREKEGDS